MRPPAYPDLRAHAVVLTILALFGLAILIAPAHIPAPAPRADSAVYIPVPTPLLDQAALAAHADSAGVPRAAAYAIAWLETRDGSCLPRCPRGRGRLDATGRRVCRAIGRMQINPCAGLTRVTPRCAYERVLASPDDNYACALTYYATLRVQHGDDEPTALARYLGTGTDANGTTDAEYAAAGLAFVGRLWFAGSLTEIDR